MLNSTEHEIHHAHNVKLPTIVGILTFGLNIFYSKLICTW